MSDSNSSLAATLGFIGELTILSVGLRLGGVIDWVNGVFSDVFPGEASDQSPAYVALEPGREEGREGDLS
ncbi:hypothetical protein LCGC14_2368180, partial [marine sediment metagenome]